MSTQSKASGISSWPKFKTRTVKDVNESLAMVLNLETAWRSESNEIRSEIPRLLVAGESEKVRLKEERLSDLETNLLRVPTVRALLETELEKNKKEQEEHETKSDGARLKILVAEVAAASANLAEISAPLLAHLRREREVHLAVERHNRRVYEARSKYGIDVEILQTPLQQYWGGEGRPPSPIWTNVQIPNGNLCGWLWRGTDSEPETVAPLAPRAVA